MDQLSHFDLKQAPFRNDFDADFIFESASLDIPLQRMQHAVESGKGLGIVTGPPGSGKSMWAHSFYEALDEDRFESALVLAVPGAVESGWLLTRVGRILGLEMMPEDRMVLLGQVYEHLILVRQEGRHTVVIIDEAQVMASTAILGEVLGLLNLEHDDEPLISFVLVGQPALATALDSDPVLEYRVETRVELQGFSSEESAEYLRHRIQLAGGKVSIFGAGAIEQVASLGRGLPRLMNTLADNALFEAQLAGQETVSAGMVQKVAVELGWCDAPAEELLEEIMQESPAAARASHPCEETMILDTIDSMGTEAIELDPIGSAPRMPAEGPPKNEEDEILDTAFADLIDE